MRTPIAYFLMLAGILFAMGTVGVLVNRNALRIFMSVELQLNAVNLAFVALSPYAGVQGQVIVFFVIAVAAAEAAVGLAIMIAVFRHRESLDMKNFSLLRW